MLKPRNMFRVLRQIPKVQQQQPLLLISRGLRGLYPEVAYSLEERLAAKDLFNDPAYARVDIGYFIPRDKKVAREEQLERRRQWTQYKYSPQVIANARTGNLLFDYEEQRTLWEDHFFRKHIKMSADHYGVFKDMYDFGFFYPTKTLKVKYPVSEDEVAPVHVGNILLPDETSVVPEVSFNAEPSEMFTLVMTSLDAHLELDDMEYLHWMVTNIPGGDISKGKTLCDYMRPFVPKGTGYHRFVFVLYKHDDGKPIDLLINQEQRSPNTISLRERTFKTLDFYRSHQASMTPCGISFFQSKWDDSLVDFFHNTLDMKVPIFEHVPLDREPLVWKKFPTGEAFNVYIDKFRDPKEIAEDIYCRRLKKLNPFEGEPVGPKFPHAHRFSSDTPSWLKSEMSLERSKVGKFKHLRKFSVEPEEDKPFTRNLKPTE